MAIMTGHLREALANGGEEDWIATNLQYDAFMQLSQLENEFFTLETSPVIDLCPSKLPKTASPNPLLTL